MKIIIRDEDNSLLASYSNGKWNGSMDVISEAVHILAMALKDQKPDKAFRKAVKPLPKVDAIGVEDTGRGKSELAK